MAETAGTSFDRLVAIMRALRAPMAARGTASRRSPRCRPFVLEETYEVLEAIEGGSPPPFAKSWAITSTRPSFSRRSQRSPASFPSPTLSTRSATSSFGVTPTCLPGSTETIPSRAVQVIERWETMKARERAAEGRDPSGRRRR